MKKLNLLVKNSVLKTYNMSATQIMMVYHVTLQLLKHKEVIDMPNSKEIALNF